MKRFLYLLSVIFSLAQMRADTIIPQIPEAPPVLPVSPPAFPYLPPTVNITQTPDPDSDPECKALPSNISVSIAKYHLGILKDHFPKLLSATSPFVPSEKLVLCMLDGKLTDTVRAACSYWAVSKYFSWLESRFGNIPPDDRLADKDIELADAILKKCVYAKTDILDSRKSASCCGCVYSDAEDKICDNKTNIVSCELRKRCEWDNLENRCFLTSKRSCTNHIQKSWVQSPYCNLTATVSDVDFFKYGPLGMFPSDTRCNPLSLWVCDHGSFLSNITLLNTTIRVCMDEYSCGNISIKTQTCRAFDDPEKARLAVLAAISDFRFKQIEPHITLEGNQSLVGGGAHQKDIEDGTGEKICRTLGHTPVSIAVKGEACTVFTPSCDKLLTKPCFDENGQIQCEANGALKKLACCHPKDSFLSIDPEWTYPDGCEN